MAKTAFPLGFGAVPLNQSASFAGVSTFNGAVVHSYVTLTDAATIAVNAALGNNFKVTLTASRNMGAPSNPADGQIIKFRIIQGGTGSYLITWNAVFDFTTTVPAPTLQTAVAKEDYAIFEYSSTAVKWRALAMNMDD